MVLRLAGDLVALGGEKGQQSGLHDRPVGLHRLARQGADVVEVDVHREPVQRQLEDVQGRAALQGDPRAKVGVGGDGLQQIQQAQHLLQGGRWQAGFAGDALQGFGGGRCHQSPSNRGLITVLGSTMFQPDAGRPSPATAPSA